MTKVRCGVPGLLNLVLGVFSGGEGGGGGVPSLLTSVGELGEGGGGRGVSPPPLPLSSSLLGVFGGGDGGGGEGSLASCFTELFDGSLVGGGVPSLLNPLLGEFNGDPGLGSGVLTPLSASPSVLSGVFGGTLVGGVGVPSLLKSSCLTRCSGT